MKTMSVATARLRLAELVDALAEGPVLLLRHGRPCAALVGLNDRFNREAFSIGSNKRLRKLVDDACRRTRETGGIPFSQILAEIEPRTTGRKVRPTRGNRRSGRRTTTE